MAKFNLEKILTHLKEKWKGRPCPLCGVGNWNLSDSVYELREFNDGNLVLGSGPILPDSFQFLCFEFISQSGFGF